MNEHLIDLTDGTRLEIKINFGTLYYLQKSGGTDLAKRIERLQKKKKDISDNAQMEFAAKVIYSVLRSNGRKVTFDEALELMYPDTESIENIMEAYEEELERSKKKEQAKQEMKKFTSK